MRIIQNLFEGREHSKLPITNFTRTNYEKQGFEGPTTDLGPPDFQNSVFSNILYSL